MKLNLTKFIPKYINKKKIFIGIEGQEIPIGKVIKRFNEKIKEIEIIKVNEKENPKFRILKALSQKDMTFDELVKETGLNYETLRANINKNKVSLFLGGFVKIKERRTFLYKNARGGCVKIIWSITEKGAKELYFIKQRVNLPRRKMLVLITSANERITLSNRWTSWLKPNAGDLKFNRDINRFIWKIPNNYILVQYEKSKGVLYSTILPKEIDINDERFITSLGLLLGEMRIRQSDISFSNTEPFLANYVLNSLEYFGISKEDFKFSVQVNTKNLKPKHEDLINYWSKELNINKDKISNIFEYKNYGTNRGSNGRIDFIYWNIVFKEIINNLINYFLINFDKNKEYATYLLRGLLASEGYVSASSKTGALDRVAISSCSKGNQISISNLLRILDINSSVKSNCVAITSKENFNKVIEYDLLKISKDKEKFKNLYNKLKYNKEILLKF